MQHCKQCPYFHGCDIEGKCVLGWIGRNIPALLNPLSRDQKTVAERQWHKPKLAPKPQKACDHGLFSDEASQLDLVEMLQDPTNGE